MPTIIVVVLVTCLWFSPTATVMAQGFKDVEEEEDRDDSLYYQQSTDYQPNPRAIVQQKAMQRAQQRQLRIASMNWFGMSNSRPTAASTPFTSLYGPAWQMPGGRPFAWNPGSPQLWQAYVR
jgi:hypothetical protein